MANRRMFSQRIGNSAKFLQMPSESQLLYFHMILRADDDGIVESYPLMKLLGIPADVFKVLIAKGFIRQLNEDQVVVITDWLEHNIIRADRKVDSVYKNLLLQKCPDLPLLEAKPRSDVDDNSKRLGGLSTDGLCKVMLGKDKIIENAEKTPPTPFSFKEYLKELEDDKRRNINVIGHFFEVKGLSFDTREQANSALKRHLRASVEVAKFSDREIVKATDEAKAQYKELFTLETIYKILTR